MELLSQAQDDALKLVVNTPSFLAPKQLTLVCARCTRFERFGVSQFLDTARAIAAAGWVQRNGKTICPNCPK